MSIHIVATFSGCTASLDLPTVDKAVGYVWDHRFQADAWKITPDDAGQEIREHILALAAAARQGGDVKQAPGEAPQSGPNEDSGNAQRDVA